MAMPTEPMKLTALAQPIERLVEPGPWDSVSGLLAYGPRLWLVNSVKFVDHNSADVYSYDPQRRRARYERHLFSQDAGTPAVAGGLLYWPLRLAGDGVCRVASWPSGRAVDALAAYRGHVYAVNVDPAGTALWRTDGRRTERVTALDGHSLRALAADQDRLWAVTVREAGGVLWRSSDGRAWSRAHTFEGDEPVAVAVYAGHAYVGTRAPGRRGALWGPPAPAPVEPPAPRHALPSRTAATADLPATLARLDRALADPGAYEGHASGLRAALEPHALGRPT